MAKLLKQSTLLSAIIVLSTPVMILLSVSTSRAAYDAATANNKHTGFYLGGTLGGYDVPTGPDEDRYGLGFNWEFRLGYQFIRYLAVEGSYHQSVGSFTNRNYATSSGTQSANGAWSFLEIAVLDIKPIIPLNRRNNLYFIAGFGPAAFVSKTSNLPSNISISSSGTAFDIGMGFEGYVTNHLSLGGELVYHNFTNNSFTVSGGPVSGDITTPYNLNMSFTSLNFVCLYHF